MSDVRMTRCIEREAAQKIICGWCGVCQHPTMEDLEKCDDICPQFAEIPDADVRPVGRGEWELTALATTYDICGLNKKIGYQCPFCGWFTRSPDNFCPHCGAYLRGGDGNG